MPDKTNQLALLFKEIQQDNKSAFDEFFVLYYDKLLAFALHYTKHQESAEEITSELFVKVWLKRGSLSTILNPEVYLFISVKNACLNLIRAEKKRFMFLHKQSDEQQMENIPDNNGGAKMEDKELSAILDQAVQALPEQRRLIFKLIKEDGLKAHEVATILTLSVRTVENQLYKAVRSLADSISIYMGYHPQRRFSKKHVLSNIPLYFF
jgi:RNA polymerase sigma-70 factor (family 1)